MKGRNKRRSLHNQIPRKWKGHDYINRNDLNMNVNYSLWAIESAEKLTGRPSYILRNCLAMEYALICAIRYVGPRRRNKMKEDVGDLEKAYWCHLGQALALLECVRSEMKEEEE